MKGEISGLVKLNCEQCHDDFLVYPSRVKLAKVPVRFCSRSCYKKWHEGRVSKVCPVCESAFEVIKARSDTAKYCSENCRKIGLAKLERTPGWNDNISKSLASRERSKSHCENISKSKTGKTMPPRSEAYKKKLSESLKGNPNVIASAQRGEKCWRWRGGITPLNKQIRELLECKQWAESVMKRDNFTCQSCGKVGGDLEAHHIKSFHEIMIEYNITTVEEAKNCKELWDVSNGKTYCRKCHMKLFHTKN